MSTIENYCIDCKSVAQPDCDARGHIVGTLGQSSNESSTTEFDQVFEQMSAPKYPAHACAGGELSSADNIECQFCDFRGTFTEGANHRRETQHLIRTVAVGNQRRAQYEPASRAGERERDKWRYVEVGHGAHVAIGKFRLSAHWQGLADSEEIRGIMRRIVTEHNQHATLIEQRERLLRLLRPVTSPTACYCAVMKDEKCWHCEARGLIATIERGGVMTQTELDTLDRGDIITHVTGDSYIVLQRHGKRLTAIREIDVSNPSEWELFSRNPRRKEKRND